MRLQEKKNISHQKPNRPFQEQGKEPVDDRMKMIYQYYHVGKSLTLEDLQYLYQKDPEGCKKLIQRILHIETTNELEQKEQVEQSIVKREFVHKNTSEREYKIEDDRIDKKDLLQTLELVKEKLEKMSDRELHDMSKNLNDRAALKDQVFRMKGLDEKDAEQLVKFAYEMEEKLDLLA